MKQAELPALLVMGIGYLGYSSQLRTNSSWAISRTAIDAGLATSVGNRHDAEKKHVKAPE